MKISFTTLGCPTWDLETIIARAKEYGYDAVDFRGLGDEIAIYELPEFADRPERTAEMFAEAGLEISGFSSSAYMFCAKEEDREASLKEVVRYGELCRAMGVGFIRVFGGYLAETGLDEAVRISVEAIEQMAAAAAPACVVVETHDNWVETAPLAKVLERVKAPNAGVLWDLHHPYRFKGESPQESYDNIGRYTRYTHVKNSLPTTDGKYQTALGGEGDVPLKEMVSLLKSGGYDGYLTLEWEKRWEPELADPEIAFPAYATFLRELAEA